MRARKRKFDNYGVMGILEYGMCVGLFLRNVALIFESFDFDLEVYLNTLNNPFRLS